MAKKRCWTFKKTCLNNECGKDFDIKLWMKDEEARQFNQHNSMCRECSEKEAKRKAAENMKLHDTPYVSEEEVKVKATDPKDDEKAEKLEKLINT